MTPDEAAELTRTDVVGPLLARTLDEPAWTQVSARLIAGGKSNLTFELSSPAGRVVLRRPPTGMILPRAHDMGREARVQAALAQTDVPVAQIVTAQDDELTGFAFYVMQRVEGHVIRDVLPPGYADDATGRVAIGEALTDTLAALHGVDPAGVGLADYGRPDDFAARQVRLWTRQWEQAATHDVPAMTELGRRLGQDPPQGPCASVVHGDFRLDNVVMDTGDPGTVAAVLDWELSTLGDPLVDLGLFLMYWRRPGDREMVLIPHLTAEPGFPEREDLVQRYASRSGLDVEGLPFYEGLAHYKFAAIAQGIAARVAAGAMGGQDFGDLDEEVLRTAETGLATLDV